MIIRIHSYSFCPIHALHFQPCDHFYPSKFYLCCIGVETNTKDTFCNFFFYLTYDLLYFKIMHVESFICI